MLEIPFEYPSSFLLVEIAVICSLCAWFFLRKIAASVFFAILGFAVSFFIFESYLYSYTEEWLGKQRVYEILFKDFPQDKDRFISEYMKAFELGGKKALAEKQEEMKIIMMVNHIGHYIENTPTTILVDYIKAETWLLSKLSRENIELCNKYLGYSGHFKAVWDAVGDEIFLGHIRYNPQMIVEAVDHPQPVSDSQRRNAGDLYWHLIRKLEADGVNFEVGNNKALSCDTAYREYYQLSQMPPEDAALIIKLLYSINHLEKDKSSGWLQKLLPF